MLQKLLQEDPLSRAIAPPANERADERARRERAESYARTVSEEIDKMLLRDKDKSHKKRAIKLLLLGQSESGKSTTLKSAFLSLSSLNQACNR